MSQDTLLSASTSAGPPVGETSLTSSSSTMTSVKYDPLVLGPVDLTHVEHISSDLSSSSIPTASIASSSSPSLRPRPPPLPPRPSSNRPISTRTQSSRSGPIGLITEPIGGFHEDFWDSANLAARDRILLEEAHRKNIAKELELERQRIVPGLNNADLLALVKSFDKQVHNVHICPEPYDGDIPLGLDLQPAVDEEFTVDKMRSCLERVYSSIVIRLIRFVMEVQRIRQWEEGGTRTLVALSVYSYAWICDLITTTFLLFLATLILSPRARKFCFSPLLRPIHPKPTSSKPMKVEPPESSNRMDEWGPAASEDKASEWADTVIDLMKAAALPKETTNEGVQQVKSGAEREINGVMVKDMKKRGPEGEKAAKEKSKKELAIELYGQPTMRVIGGLADKWERIANALNPTPPFALEPRRVEVFCYLVAPLLVVSTFITERMVSRAFGIIFGFVLFGQPVIDYALEVINQIDPQWKEKLILENNILSDVPTNAQLILRLLRDAEHRQRPLQRPMSVYEDQSDSEEEEDDHDEYEYPEDEEEEKSEDDEDVLGEGGQSKKDKAGAMVGNMRKKLGARARARKAWDKAGVLKEEGFAILTGHKKLDLESRAERIMDKLNIHKESKPARAVLKRLPRPPRDSPDAPSRFYVYHPKRGPGHLIIYPPTLPRSHKDEFVSARVRFTTVRNVSADRNVSLAEEPSPHKGDLVVSINDIVSLKKEGSSWPTRIVTSWALDADGAGGTGLEIKVVRRDAHEAVEEEDGVPTVAQGKEDTIKFTGIVRRNELFDRLISAGEQRWEVL